MKRTRLFGTDDPTNEMRLSEISVEYMRGLAATRAAWDAKKQLQQQAAETPAPKPAGPGQQLG